MFYLMGRRLRRAESASCENLSVTSSITSPLTSAAMTHRDTSSPDTCGGSSPSAAAGQARNISSPVHTRHASREFLFSSLVKPPLQDVSPAPCQECNSITSQERNTVTSQEPHGITSQECSGVTNVGFSPPLPREADVKLVRTLDPCTKFDRAAPRISGMRFNCVGDLLLADAANNKVKVFNGEGELKVECCVPRSYGSLQEPCGVCQLDSGQIIVADRQAGDLKVFTREGQLLTTFGKDLERPRDVCANTWGHVIVADEGTNDVLLYRSLSDAGVLRLNEEGPGRHLQNPCLLSIVKDNAILVSDGASGTVACYDCFGHYEGMLPVDNDILCTVLDCGNSEVECDRSERLNNHSQVDGEGRKGTQCPVRCDRSARQSDHSQDGCDGTRTEDTPTRCSRSGGHTTRSLANDRGSYALLADSRHSCVLRLDLQRHAICSLVLDSCSLRHPAAISTHHSGLLAVQEHGSQAVKIYRYLQE